MFAAPLVCVIVACHNAEPHLRATLDSVRAQEFGAWKCVVVDDGSTDATADIAADFAAADARFRVVGQQQGGVSAARNAGLDVASDGVEFVAFLDGDDVWTSDALQLLVPALERSPDAVGVYGLAEYIDEDGRPIRPGDHPALQDDRRRMGRFDLAAVPSDEPSTFDSLIVAGTIWPAGVGLHRLADVVRAGCFDPAFTRAEDWELYLRMSRYGPFVPIHEHVVWYRRHGYNATAGSQAQAMAASVLHVRWTVESSGYFPPELRREAARVWRRLAGRWVLWTATAGARALRRGDRGRALAAFGAAARFARRSWRPPPPDEQLVRDTVRYVVERSAGAGSPLP